MNRQTFWLMTACLISALITPSARAVLPEPDFILFGTVNGTPPWLTMGDAAGMTLEVRAEGEAGVLADAIIASDGSYTLRVPIDSVDPQQANTSRAGSGLDIYLDGVRLDDPNSPAALVVPPTGERGTFLVFDIDLDGLIAGTSFSVASADTVEDIAGGLVNVVITLANRDSEDTEQVNWLTVEGTATAASGDQCNTGADFVPTAGLAQFPAGQNTIAIPIVLCNDTLPENDESFVLRIANPSNQITLARMEATVTITDDDGTPSLFINDISVREPLSGSTFATFRVSLNAPQPTIVSFDYTTADMDALAGQDYVATSGRREMAVGETEVAIAVEILADDVIDDGEMILLLISNPIGAELGDNEGVASIADAQSEGTLLVDNGAGQTTLDGPIDLAIHPDGNWLYVANELGETISRFDIDPDTSTLSNELRWGPSQLPGARFDGLSSIEVSPDGNWLVATASAGDTVNLLRINADGSLAPGALARQAAMDGAAIPFAGLTAVASATFSHDGAHVYAVGIEDSLTVLTVASAAGQLLMTELEANGSDDPIDTGGIIDGLLSPRDVAVSHDGRSVYVVASDGDAVLHFSRETDDQSIFFGRVTFRSSYSQASLAQAGMDGVSRLALSGDGRSLYAASTATGLVNVFDVGVNGELAFVQSTDTAEAGTLAGASAVTLNTDNSILLATSNTPGSLHVFERSGNGQLGSRQVLLANRDAVIGLAGASALAAAPNDSNKVFAAAYTDNRVSLFALSIGSGVFGNGFE